MKPQNQRLPSTSVENEDMRQQKSIQKSVHGERKISTPHREHNPFIGPSPDRELDTRDEG
ncbi:hypothetical protein [Melghirimyces algeriensis]|uniref:Uncharacterized protein n=1 Tax=Melghirimyces algeriensis TaxID=910412 RepID=A0A521CV85_9BACL|nr:hypothetical protein [Melghirimyces algeriensis]SMO62631.1 hypothetical protein SAMN06264849_104169 [Melghirimyces algeriensis]